MILVSNEFALIMSVHHCVISADDGDLSQIGLVPTGYSTHSLALPKVN